MRFDTNNTDRTIHLPHVLRGEWIGVLSLAFLSLGAQAQTRPSIADLQTEIISQEQRIASLEANTVLGLDGYLALDTTTDPGRPIVAFEGVNVRVGNGLGSTGTTNGLGNLLIGYNEARIPGDRDECSNPGYNDSTDCLAAGGTWGPVHRGGSHNLVVGEGHNYDRNGGLVAGFLNSIRANFATVSGGLYNTARAPYASVSGGVDNVASASYASVSGGTANTASGTAASVSGGPSNTASGFGASVSGGTDNTASSTAASVSGGLNNVASASYASVSGGRNRTASGSDDWVAGGLFQDN